MTLKKVFLLIFFSFLTQCQTVKKNKTASTPEERCNSTPAYVWFHGSCQARVAVGPQMDCEAKGPTYRYVNAECIKDYDTMTPQQRCEIVDGSFWSIDKNGIGKCLTASTQNAMQQCQAKPGYLWVNSSCVSPEGQKCMAGGDVWYQDRCITTAEKVCVDHADGSLWVNTRCISKAEQDCAKNYYKKWTASPNNVYNCVAKSFVDYCTDQNPPADIQVTVAALFDLVGTSTSTHDPSECATVNSQLFQNVRDFELNDAGITNLAPLAGFTSLLRLNLSGNQISDSSHLTSLKSLQSLNLSGNRVTDISDISQLTALNSLNLNGNMITDITALNKLKMLRELYITDNKITTLDAFLDASALSTGGLSVLRTLGLANNCDLKSINGVITLPALNWLGLQNVGVSQSAVDQIKKLRPTMVVEFVPCG